MAKQKVLSKYKNLYTIFNRSSSIYQEMKLKSLHINQFLLYHNIPSSLRLKILSYMEFLIEYRSKHKLDEIEVLDLLNESLREQVIANINGRILNKCEIFDQFDMILISEITFILTRKLYAMNDTVFEEGERGDKIFFIGKGSVILLQIKTHTYIKQLEENQNFGAVAFFSRLTRSCTVRTNDFTQMLVLNFNDFEKTLQSHKIDQERYRQISQKINSKRDYSDIRILCYICQELGHMATECTEFWKIKGNILNKTHTEVITEKKKLADTVGFYRRLSKRSFILEEDLKSSLHLKLKGENPVRSGIRRASYMPPERIIVEESENSSESSSLKSKSPTSSSNSDSNSSFNIFGNQQNLSDSLERDTSSRPLINVNKFSTSKVPQLRGILKTPSRSSKDYSLEDNSSISSSRNSHSKSSFFKQSKKNVNNLKLHRKSRTKKLTKAHEEKKKLDIASIKNQNPFFTHKKSSKLDPNIMSQLDPRLFNPAGFQTSGSNLGAGLTRKSRKSTILNINPAAHGASK